MTGMRAMGRVGLMRAALGLACAVLAWSGPSTGPAAQEAAAPGYTVTVRSESLQARLFVNGAPLFFYVRRAPLLMTVAATGLLQPGRNVITLDYEPLDWSRRQYAPHGGVALSVSLARRSGAGAASGVEASVDLASGRYDPGARRMVFHEASAFTGEALRRSDGGLEAGPVEAGPVKMLLNGRVSGEYATRVEMVFDIADAALSAPPWADAPALSDTPALRSELAARYRELHRIIAEGDEAAYRRKMNLVYSHGARTRGYADAAALADDIRAGAPLGPREGETLAPPPADLESRVPEFGSDRRLVRLTPDPIGFVSPGGDSLRSDGVFFCRVGDALEICFAPHIAP